MTEYGARGLPSPPPDATWTQSGVGGVPAYTGATDSWGAPPTFPPPNDSWSASDPSAELRADQTASGIASYERVSGVLWIVLGVFQIFSVVLIIAGVWNVFAGITRLGYAPRIERRESGVPAAFSGVTGLIVIGLINLFFGAVFGLVMVAVDFYIRQRVLDNRHIFTR